MSSNDKIRLKLIGKNQDDLKVISAYLQDSIVIIKDIVFLKKNKTFIMIVNRFMWEDVERGFFRQSKRIRCAIRFEQVFEVKSKNINQKNKNLTLELFAINMLKNKEKFEINLLFKDNSCITLSTEIVEVILEDQKEI